VSVADKVEVVEVELDKQSEPSPPHSPHVSVTLPLFGTPSQPTMLQSCCESLPAGAVCPDGHNLHVSDDPAPVAGE
jgi:hypothetical protein